jgi:hypothetical protein
MLESRALAARSLWQGLWRFFQTIQKVAPGGSWETLDGLLNPDPMQIPASRAILDAC